MLDHIYRESQLSKVCVIPLPLYKTNEDHPPPLGLLSFSTGPSTTYTAILNQTSKPTRIKLELCKVTFIQLNEIQYVTAHIIPTNVTCDTNHWPHRSSMFLICQRLGFTSYPTHPPLQVMMIVRMGKVFILIVHHFRDHLVNTSSSSMTFEISGFLLPQELTPLRFLKNEPSLYHKTPIKYWRRYLIMAVGMSVSFSSVSHDGIVPDRHICVSISCSKMCHLKEYPFMVGGNLIRFATD